MDFVDFGLNNMIPGLNFSKIRLFPGKKQNPIRKTGDSIPEMKGGKQK